MLVGRAPCFLGNHVFRGRVSSHRLPSFEDAVIFLFDVEKCLKQLDRFSQVVVTHIALEDYTPSGSGAFDRGKRADNPPLLWRGAGAFG